MGNYCDKNSSTGYNDRVCAFCSKDSPLKNEEKCKVCNTMYNETYNKDLCNSYELPKTMTMTDEPKTVVTFDNPNSTPIPKPAEQQPIINPYMEAAPTSGGSSSGGGSSMAGVIAIILILIIVGVGVAVIIKKKRAAK